MKEIGKEIIIKNIAITDNEEEIENYEKNMLSYRYGFKCGYENMNFEDNYNEHIQDICLNGYKDGYKDGNEYRKKEFAI